jgi:hypothetical protein
MAAMNTQIAHDVAPAYGLTATLIGPTAPPPGAWAMILKDDSDQPGALGYHEVLAGVPTGYVFVKTCLSAIGDWTSCLSHEIIEMIADPTCDKQATSGGHTYDYEACDPVEADGYMVNGVNLSNFVLPAWYVTGRPGPYDFLGKLQAPLTIDAGGYMTVDGQQVGAKKDWKR